MKKHIAIAATPVANTTKPRFDGRQNPPERISHEVYHIEINSLIYVARDLILKPEERMAARAARSSAMPDCHSERDEGEKTCPFQCAL
jgi:hypothetical protein